jgi:hypothetical protein
MLPAISFFHSSPLTASTVMGRAVARASCSICSLKVTGSGLDSV